MGEDDILSLYRALERDDIRATLRYAVATVRERKLSTVIPQ